MAEFTIGYKANGVLSISDMELTETTKKEGIKIHDIKAALQRFEGQDVSFSISVKEDVTPKATEATEATGE